jgi:hypothetical protein
MLLCVVNTSERCFAESSAFSLSLLAHGPGGMEFVQIGGSGVCGVCGFFPGFYCFPDGVFVSFENRDVGDEGCVPHFMKGGLQFVAGFVEETTVFC